MAANNSERYRPLFSVIPPFVLNFPTSFVGNLIPCRAAKTNKVKEAPRKVFAFGAAQPPAQQPSSKSLPVGFEESFGKMPQLSLTERPLPEPPPPKSPSEAPQPAQQGNQQEIPSWVAEAVRQEARMLSNWHVAAHAAQQETAAHLANTHRAEQLCDKRIVGGDTNKEP